MEQKSNPPEGDELKLATRKSLFRLLSFLDSKLPESCAIHSFVSAALLTASPTYRVYYRQRRPTNSAINRPTSLDDEFCIIVGVGMERFINSNQETKKCWFFSAWTDDDDGKLADAYKAIDIIDWSLDVLVVHNNYHTPHPAIKHFITGKRTISHCYPCNQYVLSSENGVLLHAREIDDVYVKSLERHHAQIVYDNWPYRAGTSVENVAMEIEQLPSAGVFLKENDNLVSWIMCHPPNGMSRLHTLHEFRRRGYAALVTQYLSKRIAQCGFLPFVNIDTENGASQTFFEKMKFYLLRPVHVWVAEPKENSLT